MKQMKAEYDFSKGERGKFYHPEAVFSFPVYLESDVNDFTSWRMSRTLTFKSWLTNGSG